MLANDILLLLMQTLGPLKIQAQQPGTGFEKFQDILQQTLSQPTVEFRQTGVQLPVFHNNRLPEHIQEELEQMTAGIVKAQATRQPADPVFWMRRRNTAFTAGFEENAANFIQPDFSFGPFVHEQQKPLWFDFFQVSRQCRIEIAQSGIPDTIVITLPPGVPLPAAGLRDKLELEDCTVWVSIKTIVFGAAKKYAGFRAKNCIIQSNGKIAVQATGFVSILATQFQVNFEPGDSIANAAGLQAPPKASYPDRIEIDFTGSKWSLTAFNGGFLTVNGDSIALQQNGIVQPVFLEAEQLVRFPLRTAKEQFTIGAQDATRFQLSGQTTIAEPSWWLPVVSIDNAVGVGGLGMHSFSGYLGFRGKQGLLLSWPGLENGPLSITQLLLLARPSRTNLRYSYEAGSRSRQQLAAWQSGAVADDRNIFTLQPLPAGEGNCMVDNQPTEMLMQPVLISALADRPLNTQQQRFDMQDYKGAVVFEKTGAETAVYLLGLRQQAAPGDPPKKRIPQSLCLHNGLLTVDNPISIFLEAQLLTDGIMGEGFFYPSFPVYRLVNTLPDPYISNQQDIFNTAFLEFTERWRKGQNTLNDQFLFSVTAIVQWNPQQVILRFTMNQASVINTVNDMELARAFRGLGTLCGSNAADNDFITGDINQCRQKDTANLAGAYDFLQFLPGDRTLVDVSGVSNCWGVAFPAAIGEDKKMLPESLGFPAKFPFRIKDMDIVSSGRMSRLFTLPHVQWEPVMQVNNPSVPDTDIPDIISFTNNGNPTRIATAQKNEVALAPAALYQFFIEGFNSSEKPFAMAANFSLPFGICAVAYFNPKAFPDLPGATAKSNMPVFQGKKTGPLSGGMQLQVKAQPNAFFKKTDTDNRFTYFLGSARLSPLPNGRNNATILGNIISNQFFEFAATKTAKLPLQQIDFAGYGASIFSNWRNEIANFGQVSQVRFDVLIGRTAHEVVQIKSILFPWAVPVVRSVVMHRTNTGIVTRYDSGWVATGPGEFDFRSAGIPTELNPYNFHPGVVKGVYNVTEIRDLPPEMDIIISSPATIRFSGVYFNGDIGIENIVKGALPVADKGGTRTHSAGQLGYVMLADPTVLTDKTLLKDIFTPAGFKQLLSKPQVGGSLGGPLNAVMRIAGSSQRMQLSRVDISASNEAVPSFVVAVRGTIELPKEGSWNVVKCLQGNEVVPLKGTEAVPLIRNGLLSISAAGRSIAFNDSHHSPGDPAEIARYINGGTAPNTQYSFLQSTGTQKLLFRQPSFFVKDPQKIFTKIPAFADAFRLLDCKTIFPDISKTLSLPAGVDNLLMTGDGLQFDEAFFNGPINLNNFVPPQLQIPAARTFKLINQPDFKVWIQYTDEDDKPSSFKIDLNSDALINAAENERKKFATVNKDVAIEVHLGPLTPLFTLRGSFRAQAGEKPVFENPRLQLGGNDLEKVKSILQVLATLGGEGDKVADSLNVTMSNTPDSWNYKMSIDQNIPVIQFPNTAEITLTTPPPLIIEASLILGVFFNLSLSPDPSNLIRPGAGAVFGFEGMLQIQLITIGIAAAYGVGITKVRAFVDLSNPQPEFEFTFGFGATVIVDLPVVGLVSVTRSFSLTGNIDTGRLLIEAGQMLRGILSLAGGLLVVGIQIEGKTGLLNTSGPDNKSTKAIFEMIFSLDVSLAFVISYDFSKPYREEITLS
jgi:hypothetical protein